jgi:hypothetical protein
MPYKSLPIPLLKDIAIPCAKKAFQLLLDKGFINLPIGRFVNDIVRTERDEESCSLGIVYVIVDTLTGQIKTVGSTKNAKNRQQHRQEKGTVGRNRKMHRIFNIDCLTATIDNALTDQTKEMLDRFIAHSECPLPLRRVFEAYRLRGGEKLSFLKNCTLQMIELGAKCHFRLRSDFEFLMFNAEIYHERKVCVLEAWNFLRPKLEEIYGGEKAEGNVKVKFASSWKPGGSDTLNDGSRRLESKKVAMESIAGHPIDMSQTNMVHVPPYPGAKHKSKMFDTKGYTAAQLTKGLEKFRHTIDSLQEYEFLDLDSNKFLFQDDPRGSLHFLMSAGWKIKVICWNFEIVLLQHPTLKMAIWLHLPYCLFAPGQKRPLETIVKRNLAIQLSKLAVAWCQGELDHHAQMNGTFHDAALAAFAYEHAITACHSGPMHAAASARDILTYAGTYALLQNDLYGTKDGADSMPMAFNLRKKVYLADSDKTAKKQFDLNALVIRRALNVLRSINDIRDIKAGVKKIQTIFMEDKPRYQTQLKRWEYLYHSLKPDSKLVPAIKQQLPKQNTGNRGKKGRCSKERKVQIDADLKVLKTLTLDQKFWVRLEVTDKSHPPEESEKKLHGADIVFLNLIFKSVKNHFNTVDRDSPYMILHKVQAKKGFPAIISKNKAFVLCQLGLKAGTMTVNDE